MNLRLRRHYSRLILACTVPLTLVVLALIVFQYHTQRANELVDLRQMASGQRLALNQILGAARDHVELLRRWSEQNLLAPAAAGSPRPGDPIEAGMVEDLYRLIELTHPLTPVLDRSYFFSAGGDPVALYPPLPHWQTEPGAHLDRATLHGYGAFRKVEPAANPLRRGRWNVPEHDAIDPGLMLSYAEPVYRGDTFVGAVVVDLRLEFLTGLLRSMHYPAGRLWLIDNNGRVLTDTRAVHARGGWAPTGAPPDSWTELDASPHGHFQPLADQQLLVLPLGDAPWTLLYAISERELKNLLLPRLLPYGIILAGLCLTLFLTQWLLRRRFINPALALINYIGQADDRLQQQQQGGHRREERCISP